MVSLLYLYKKKTEKTFFTVPTFNNSQPAKRYQCKSLPQGMFNSPTLCQYFVSQSLEIIHRQLPKYIIYHYMDDIFILIQT